MRGSLQRRLGQHFRISLAERPTRRYIGTHWCQSRLTCGELDGEIIVLGDRFPAIATEQSPSRAMAFVDDSVPMGNIDELYFLSDSESWV